MTRADSGDGGAFHAFPLPGTTSHHELVRNLQVGADVEPGALDDNSHDEFLVSEQPLFFSLRQQSSRLSNQHARRGRVAVLAAK